MPFLVHSSTGNNTPTHNTLLTHKGVYLSYVICYVCSNFNNADYNLFYRHGDESFQIAVAMGVRSHRWKFGNMPAIENLPSSDVTAIVVYVREPQRANGIF